MPTPLLPSRDDDEHGAMPADCRVETLAEWLVDIPLNDDSEFDFPAVARAVRALVEAKVREAVCSRPPKVANAIVSRVLGSPS